MYTSNSRPTCFLSWRPNVGGGNDSVLISDISEPRPFCANDAFPFYSSASHSRDEPNFFFLGKFTLRKRGKFHSGKSLGGVFAKRFCYGFCFRVKQKEKGSNNVFFLKKQLIFCKNVFSRYLNI